MKSSSLLKSGWLHFFLASILIGFSGKIVSAKDCQASSGLLGVIAVALRTTDEGELKNWSRVNRVQLRANYASKHGVFQIKTTSSDEVERILRCSRESGLFAFVEPSIALGSLQVANDPRMVFKLDWAKHNVGQKGGSPDADIDAPEAWLLANDASDVVIAVIDSGIRSTHEDLSANMWINKGEIPANGKDDDGNGVVDDVHGFSAVTEDGDIHDGSGHGTSVAGVIASVGNNGLGTAGVVWSTQLMAVKFLDDHGNGSTAAAVDCIHYALDNGADIINASWGGSRRSRALDSAIARAESMGVPVVVAAGNSNTNTDRGQHYPASYRHSNMIVVGASDRNDVRHSLSNYGDRSVDLFAPGDFVLTCSAESDSAYILNSGTSLAAPYVTGALALLMSAVPEASLTTLFTAVIESVDPVPNLPSVAKGRLNLHGALVAMNIGEENPSETPLPPMEAIRLGLRIVEGQSILSFDPVPSFPVLIETSADLHDWYPLLEVSQGDTMNGEIVVGTSNQEQNFFRIR